MRERNDLAREVADIRDERDALAAKIEANDDFSAKYDHVRIRLQLLVEDVMGWKDSADAGIEDAAEDHVAVAAQREAVRLRAELAALRAKPVTSAEDSW